MNPLFRRFSNPVNPLPLVAGLGDIKMSGLRRSLDYFSDPQSLPMDFLLAFVKDLYLEAGEKGVSKLLRLNEAYISAIDDSALVERLNGKILLSQSAISKRVKNGISGFASAFASSSEQQQRQMLLMAFFRCMETQPQYLIEAQLAYHRPSVLIKKSVDLALDDSLETLTYRDVPFPYSILITPTAALLEKNVLPTDVVKQALLLASSFRAN
jgi:hypothetical protein